MAARRTRMPSGRPKANQRPRKRRFLVVTNGEVTELEYFEGLRSELEDVVIDVRSDRLDPAALSRKAYDLVKREGTSKRREADGFQKVYVVTDVDDFTAAQFRAARDMCKKGDMALVISNPCFEVWLVDHLATCPESFTEAKAVESRAAKLGIVHGSRNKHVDYQVIKGKGADACSNARRHNTSERAGKRGRLDSMDFAPWTDMPEVYEGMQS